MTTPSLLWQRSALDPQCSIILQSCRSRSAVSPGQRWGSLLSHTRGPQGTSAREGAWMAPEGGSGVHKWYLLTSACGKKLYTFIISMAWAFSQPLASSRSLCKTKTAQLSQHSRGSPRGELLPLSISRGSRLTCPCRAPRLIPKHVLLISAGPGRAGL